MRSAAQGSRQYTIETVSQRKERPVDRSATGGRYAPLLPEALEELSDNSAHSTRVDIHRVVSITLPSRSTSSRGGDYEVTITSVQVKLNTWLLILKSDMRCTAG